MLASLQSNFPNMRFLIIVDIVSHSKMVPTIMPGFDYVHGLQGFVPRSYEQTHDVFKSSHYEIFDEIAVSNMPNTFIWSLKPTRFNKNTRTI
jgi:hypothetical protein